MEILKLLLYIILTFPVGIFIYFWFWPWLSFEYKIRRSIIRLKLIIAVDNSIGNDTEKGEDIVKGLRAKLKKNKLFNRHES